MSAPDISVVTPTRDAAATLARALESLDLQNVTYESIVVDGGSRDATLAIAARRLDTRVIVAPGTSIYEALNIGIAAATAPLIGFLNGDDCYLGGALDAAVIAAGANRDAAIIRGTPEFVEVADDTTKHDTANERRAAPPLTLDTILNGPVAINSMFFRKELFELIGPFNSHWRIAADRDWLLRAWSLGTRVYELGSTTYRYYIHSGSMTLDRARRNYRAIRMEHLSIARSLLTQSGGVALKGPLRRWHGREATLLIADLLRQGEWSKAAAESSAAFMLAPLWPCDAAVEIARWSALRLL